VSAVSTQGVRLRGLGLDMHRPDNSANPMNGGSAGLRFQPLPTEKSFRGMVDQPKNHRIVASVSATGSSRMNASRIIRSGCTIALHQRCRMDKSKRVQVVRT